AIAAAISLGDYDAYSEIETYLKGYVSADNAGMVSKFAELGLATAAVSAIAPNMAPGWLKEGDFSGLPAQAKPDALYLHSKYYQSLGNYEAMLSVAQTTLTFCASEQGITLSDIYLRVNCASACYSLERMEEAKRRLRDAMHIALPHGFITPFAESVTAFGGLMEQCLKQEFPDAHDAVIAQWERSWKNWIHFHNDFTKNNITLILTRREYHIAVLAAKRVPYADIAKRYQISIGRLKNIMLAIYGKLYISDRNELAKYIL
ncbi:MAG: hypothetical protein AAGU32_19510, partial [Bacillota bacterium]